ncbi:transmembrane protein 238-like [Bos javanicus]|nr:transmembrane protein 238-like [Bos javanicus]
MPGGERRERLAAPPPARAGRPGERSPAPPASAFQAMLPGKLWGTCRLGRCALFFGLALLLDVVGLVLLLVGIFASLDFWDFLIYTGSLILAFSLLFWIAWYTLNMEVPLEKLDL